MTTRTFDLSRLRAHVRDFHPDMAMARSNAALSDRHHRQHHTFRSGTGHVHIGDESPLVDYGIGRGMRPESWTTGKGAVDRTAYDRQMHDVVIGHGKGMTAYRWRGTSRRGVAMSDVISLKPASVARLIGTYWRLGWRDFLICSGDGPVPPAADDPNPVGEIFKRDGRRTWWAEKGE
jgi:hypothetical protein